MDSLSLFHPSFVRFLTDATASGAFFCDPVEENQRIVAQALAQSTSLEEAVSGDNYLFRYVVAHLIGAGDITNLESLLSSYSWLYGKLDRLGVEPLISDYEMAPLPGAGDVAAVLRQVAHIVTRDRSQIAGQIMARLAGNDAPLVTGLLRGVVGVPGLAWLRPMNTQGSQSSPRQTLKLRGSDQGLGVSGVGLSADGDTGIVAVNSNLVLIDIRVGREIRTFYDRRRITAVGIADDGAIFASASEHELRIWNAQGPIHRLDWDVDQNSPVVIVDGLVFAVCDRLRCWDWRSQEEVRPPFESSEETLAGRGSFVTGNGTVWRARDSSESYRIAMPRPASGCNVDITSDASLLAYANHDVVVWDVRGDREYRLLSPVREPGEKAFQRLAFCNKGRTLAMLSYDFRRVLRPPWLCAWDIESGRLLFETTCHADQAVDMAGSTETQHVITGTIHGEVRIWDLGALTATTNAVKPHRERIVQLVGAGTEVISGDEGGRIAVWSGAEGRMLRTWNAHTDAISSLDVSLKGDRLFSSGLDGRIREWHTASGTEQDEIIWEGCIPEKICFIDESTLLCFGDDGRIGRWDTRKRAWTTDRQPSSYGGVVTGICSNVNRSLVAFTWAPGRKMWVGTSDLLIYGVEIWSVNEAEVLGGKDYSGREHSPVPGISPDGKLTYAAQGHTIQAFDTNNGQLVSQYDHEDEVTYIALAPSGRLAVATNGGLLRVWHESSCLPVADFELDAVITAMTFITDSTLSIGTETGDVLLFQVVE